MAIELKLTPNGLVVENEKLQPVNRHEKGKSIISFPDTYVIIDIETTGLYSRYDKIIEICALKIIDGAIEDSFSSLVNPQIQIDEFIEQLTGISNEMVQNAPSIENVLPVFLSFVGNQIVVGHNIHFDINFLYDASVNNLKRPFSNNFIDTRRIFRKLHPELKHHRLSDMVKFYQVQDLPSHRAEADCMATFSCYLQLQREISRIYDNKDQFIALFNHKKHRNLDLRTIKSDNIDFDSTNPFFEKHCVFTGTLDRLSRKDAAQLVVDLGGIADNGITKQTNFLILGNNDYCKSIKDGKSTKQKKAEEYILKGYDIEILSEQVFYEMLDL